MRATLNMDGTLIENSSLMGRGLGYIAIHSLASSILGNVVLWTADRRLREAVAELGISHVKYLTCGLLPDSLRSWIKATH